MPEPVSRVPGDLWLRVGERLVEPGFAAVIGPVGIYPLRRRQDLVLLRRIREINPRIVFASLSSRYVTTIIHQPREFDNRANSMRSRAARYLRLLAEMVSASRSEPG